MKRLGWAVGAGALFTTWGLLGWASANEPDQTPFEGSAVTLHEDGSGELNGTRFCLEGWACDE